MAFYRSQAPRHFVVWSECWPSVELFCACNTQWRIKPMGGVQGLDYSAVRAVLEMRGVLDKGALFDDVRLMEFGALAALNGKTLDELIYG